MACVLGLGFGVAGCFNPHVQSGGFACSMTDNPPCPAGYHCVDGLCLDHAAVPGAGVDMSGGGTGGNGADQGTDGGAGDMSMSAADLSMAPADLAQPPPADMAQSCNLGQSGDFCLSDSDCCSDSCFFFTCD